MAVAVDLHHGFKLFTRSQRCSLQSLSELDNNILSQTKFIHHLKQAFEVASFHRSFSTPCLSLATKVEERFETNPRIEVVGSRGASRVRALIVEVSIALASGVDPKPVSSGLGGAYFMRSQNGKTIAVAKPVDEEPLAINNPKGFAGLTLGQPGMKPSVRVGETGLRELAAYLLDHGGFAGVPPTALVKISHVVFHVNNANTIVAPYKIASLQRYVDHDFDAGELGPSGFSVASVHRIGIFDIRILNLDRHAGNILIKKQNQQNKYDVGAAELVPIDHGLCLPEWIDDPYFEWLHWPQASVPFSEVEMEYIANLDPINDAELLRKEVPSISESSIRVLVICTNFLKRAAAAGLCLANIGEMMSREFCIGEENLSVLENLCLKAKASVLDLAYRGEDNNSNGEMQEDFEEKEMFQFEEDDEDSANGEVPKLPPLFQNPPKMSKPPKIPKFAMVKSTTELSDARVYEQNNCMDGDNGRKESIDDIEGGDKGKRNGLLRSTSLSAENYTCEIGGVSFGDMSEDEWGLFMRSYEELLPKLFEGTKCMGLKQRLGTSCEF